MRRMLEAQAKGQDWHQVSPVIQQGLLQWGLLIEQLD